jgi:hypothetical protein
MFYYAKKGNVTGVWLSMWRVTVGEAQWAFSNLVNK